VNAEGLADNGSASIASYKRQQFTAEIIAHAAWPLRSVRTHGDFLSRHKFRQMERFSVRFAGLIPLVLTLNRVIAHEFESAFPRARQEIAHPDDGHARMRLEP
jgi:hypothetical protein